MDRLLPYSRDGQRIYGSSDGGILPLTDLPVCRTSTRGGDRRRGSTSEPPILSATSKAVMEVVLER